MSFEKLLMRQHCGGGGDWADIVLAELQKAAVWSSGQSQVSLQYPTNGMSCII